MNILRFEANTPIQVALKFDGGCDVDGRYGLQVLYTLDDGRLMYVEPKVARRINELKITAGEPFSICKREAKIGLQRTVEWEVNRLEPVPATARLEIVPPGGGNEPSASKSTLRAAKIEPDRAPQPINRRTAVASALNKPAVAGDARPRSRPSSGPPFPASPNSNTRSRPPLQPPPEQSSSDTRSATQCALRPVIFEPWP